MIFFFFAFQFHGGGGGPWTRACIHCAKLNKSKIVALTGKLYIHDDRCVHI